MAYRIKVIAGPGVGSELELDDGDSTIGRAPENTLVINDGNVSRVHARFRSNGNRIAVMDAGSRNGVYVNDRKLDVDEQQPLGPGDRVVIGQSIIELFTENGGAARPRTGAVPGAVPGQRAPAQRPNGNGNMTGTGAINSGGVPASRAPVPVGKPGQSGRAPVPAAGQRPGTAPVPRQPGGPVAQRQPGTGGSPKVVNKKEGDGGFSKPLLFGIVGLAVVVAFGAVLINGSKGGKPKGDGADVPVTPKQLVIPQMGGVIQSAGSEDKCSPKCQRALDIGDSQRDSNNLKAARDSFQEAVDLEPTCLSCAVRLEAVERSLEIKIREYEKAGVLSFEKGDFQRAIDSWEIGVELMPDPTKMKDATKKAQTEARRRELKKKIDEANKLIERQPQ